MVQSLRRSKSFRILFNSPELVEEQRSGFHSFLKEGIAQELSKLSLLQVRRQFVNIQQLAHMVHIQVFIDANNFQLIAPDDNSRDCVLKMKTYACKLYVQAKIVWKKGSGEILMQTEPEWVLLAHLPMMTKRGHFVINGSPRVIVHQVVRAPGVYFQKFKKVKKDERNKARFYGDIIPLKGAWVRLQISKTGEVEIKLKRSTKVPAEMVERCLAVIEKQELSKSHGVQSKKVQLDLYSNFERFFRQDSRKAIRYLAAELEQSSTGNGNRNQSSNQSSKVGYGYTFDQPNTVKSYGLQSRTFVIRPRLSHVFQDPLFSTFTKIGSFPKVRRSRTIAFPNRKYSFKSSVVQPVKELGLSLNLKAPKSEVVTSETDYSSFLCRFPKTSIVQATQTRASQEFSRASLELDVDRFLGFQEEKHDQFTRSEIKGDRRSFASVYDHLYQLPELQDIEEKFIDTTFKSNMSYDQLFKTFKSPWRYNLGEVGRTKLNNKFGLSVTANQLTSLDVQAARNWLYRLRAGKETIDDIDHSQNRRVRKSGELIQSQFENGVTRLRKFLRKKLKTPTFQPLLAFEVDPSSKCGPSSKLLPLKARFVDSSFLGVNPGPVQDQSFLKPAITKSKVLVDTNKRLVTGVQIKKNAARSSVESVLDPEKVDVKFLKSPLPLKSGYLNRSFGLLNEGNWCKTTAIYIPEFSTLLGESSLEKRLSMRFRPETAGFIKLTRPLRLIRKSVSFFSRKNLWKIRENLCFCKPSKYTRKRKPEWKVGIDSKETPFNSFISRLLLIDRPDCMFQTRPAEAWSQTHVTGDTPKKFPYKIFGVSLRDRSVTPTVTNQRLVQSLVAGTKFRLPDQSSIGSKGVHSKIRDTIKSEHLNPKICQLIRDRVTELQLQRVHKTDSKFIWSTKAKACELFSTKPINGALREFFGSNPLSQYMDQSNPLAEVTHKRRISSLGIGGVSRESAGMAIRGIHPTHYGRICPIETPEGKNAGLVNSLAFYARLNLHGFVETPYYKVLKGQVQEELGFCFYSARNETVGGLHLAPSDLQQSQANMLGTGLVNSAMELPPTQASSSKSFASKSRPLVSKVSTPVTRPELLKSVDKKLIHLPTPFVQVNSECLVPVRVADTLLDIFKKVSPSEVDCIGISPVQILSVATSLIPFLEHNDANRALMGSNMQRQAVPLMIPERPIVGTGLETLIAAESGQLIQSSVSGIVSHVSANKIVIERLVNTASNSAQLSKVYPFKKWLHTQIFQNNKKSCEGVTVTNRRLVQNLLLRNQPLVGSSRVKGNPEGQSLEIEENLKSVPVQVLVLRTNKTRVFEEERAFVKGIRQALFSECKLYLVTDNKRCNSSFARVRVGEARVRVAARKTSNTVLSERSRFARLLEFEKSLISKDLRSESIQKADAYQPTPQTHPSQVKLGLLRELSLVLVKPKPSKAVATLSTSQVQAKPDLALLSWVRGRASRRVSIYRDLSQRQNCSNFSETRSSPFKLSFAEAKLRKLDYLNYAQLNDSLLGLGRTTPHIWLNSIVSGYSTQPHARLAAKPSSKYTLTASQSLAWPQTLTLMDHNLRTDQRSDNLAKRVTATNQRLVRKLVRTKLEGSRSLFSRTGFDLWPNSVQPAFAKNQVRLLKSRGFKKLESRRTSRGWPGVTKQVETKKTTLFKSDDFKGKNREVFFRPAWFSKAKCILPSDPLTPRFSDEPKGVLASQTLTLTRAKLELELHLQRSTLSIFKTLLPFVHSLRTFNRSNQETCLTQKPLVQEGEWVQKGEILSDCCASEKGELAVGKNVLIAYLPWEGYNFEDAIVVSDRLTKEQIYSSLHIERYVCEVQDIKEKLTTSIEWFTSNLPGVNPKSVSHLDIFGFPKIGTILKEGDILVGKMKYFRNKPTTPHENLLRDILGDDFFSVTLTSLRVPKGVHEARVISHRVVKTYRSPLESTFKGLSRPAGTPKMVHIFLGEKRSIQVGDKMSGRHGNKGIISTILPKQDMPYLPNGAPIDILLNPLGVPSRMNVGQIFESLLGLASTYLNQNFKITAFDEVYGVEASQSLVYLKLYQARLQSGQNWLFQINFPGKSRLIDGRSGESLDQWVTVGRAYMLKLIHMVNEKIHARSTGPYALITQQPLRGRSHKGGQRLGEMEVWALEAYGAAYILQELLTKKSDDFDGRQDIIDSLVVRPKKSLRIDPNHKHASTNDPYSKYSDPHNPDRAIEDTRLVLGHPEIFKTLICELQALCLDVGVYALKTKSFQREYLGIVT